MRTVGIAALWVVAMVVAAAAQVTVPGPSIPTIPTLPPIKPDLFVTQVFVNGQANYVAQGACGSVINVDRAQALRVVAGKFEFKITWQIQAVGGSAGPFGNTVMPPVPLTPASLTLPGGGVGIVYSTALLNPGPNVFTFHVDNPDAVAESNEGNNVCRVTIFVR